MSYALDPISKRPQLKPVPQPLLERLPISLAALSDFEPSNAAARAQRLQMQQQRQQQPQQQQQQQQPLLQQQREQQAEAEAELLSQLSGGQSVLSPLRTVCELSSALVLADSNNIEEVRLHCC